MTEDELDGHIEDRSWAVIARGLRLEIRDRIKLEEKIEEIRKILADEG